MIYQFDEFSINTGLYELSRQDQSLPLEPLAFDLLVYLIQHRDRVVEREELLDSLWSGKVVTDSALAARIKDTRKAIGDSGERQQFIKTVHGRGYQFVAGVETPEVESASIFDQIDNGQRLEYPSLPSIAVLPFANETQDPEDEYLSNGVTDALRYGLTRFRELFVMGRSSSVGFRNTDLELTKIGQQMGVRYLVLGAVRRQDRHLGITIELVDTLTGQNTWSGSYHRPIQEFFEIEDEIIRTIVAALVHQVENITFDEIRGRVAENLEAWEWVLRGNRLYELGEKEDLLQAREMYEHALELDPNNSAAYTGLSNVTLHLVWGNPAKDYRDSVKRSLEYGQRAVTLDDQDSRAHYAVGHGYICLAQHDMAEAHVDQALTLNPGEYHNLCFKGYMLACTGHHEESRTAFGESIRRNPLSPKSCFCGVGISDYLASNYADATVMLRRLSGYGYFAHKYCGLAAAHAQLGNEDQATEALQKYRTELDPAVLSHLGDDSDRWRQYISNVYSILQPDDVEHVFEGLSKAGLTD